ncbi:zinc finger (CCCH-type) family protein [Actinidia rufa]|uniref:Zinc finger (CCCH-type) family protein n=1 Tax=Actinidia rufa TaxID=165716 RepID=A0A7J0DT72_9ERIC|nr:zinc finger (CCCH-type) family protein [Actinidia rufa]
MADDEERVLEEELELQLQEQRDSLSAIEDALAYDPSNPELVPVYEELVQAIKDAEDGLLGLKRARLMREADSVLEGSNYIVEDAKVELLDPTQDEAEPLEDQSYSVGSKCRFRHTDGHWYNGLIVWLEGSNSAKISFLTPTSENMLLHQLTNARPPKCRCASSFYSSGVDLVLTAAYHMVLMSHLSSLKKYISTVWEQSLVGSGIWAVSDSNTGIWREAELESWDDELRAAQVVFRGDGTSSKLGTEAISLSEYAQMSDEEVSDSSSEQSDSSDYEEDISQGLGFLEGTALQKGIQTETALFSKWENHTRGIASKMMANMGYREGMGLGISGQGMVDPISVKVFPPKQSLDHALESRENEKNKENRGKKRSRGGKRKRDKKFAAAAKAAKEEEESQPDVFSLINSQLAMHGEAMNGRLEKQQRSKGFGERKKKKTGGPYLLMMMRKFNEARKALAEAEAAHASASKAVASRERREKWLKF